MIRQFKNMSDSKKRVLGNVASLSILQCSNYILPLITLPYLLRVLGPEKFGLVAFAQALMFYFVLLTDYGFRLSATRRVSICRDNAGELSSIVSRVLVVELVMMALSFLLLTVIVVSVERLRADWRIYLLTFGMVPGHVLFTVWFFQGIERMKYITLLGLTARLVFLVAIFVLVRSPSDYLYVPALNCLGWITAGVVCMSLLHLRFGIRFVRVSASDVLSTLREGFPVFMTSVFSGEIVLSTAAFVIGVFHGNAAVGYFSVAEKLLRALVMIRYPVTAGLFPFFSKRFEQRTPGTIASVLHVAVLLSAVYLPATIIVAVFADRVVEVISGGAYAESAGLLRIGVFYVLFNMYNSLAGVIVMLNVGLKRELMWIRLIKYVVFVILLLVVVWRWALVGAIVLICLVELAETLLYLLVGMLSKGWRALGYAKNNSDYSELAV